MNERSRRIQFGVERKNSFEIDVDGDKILAFEGETVAAALLASGRRVFRKTEIRKSPRGLYCGIGHCQECRMTINGVANALACQTTVTPGCKIETGLKSTMGLEV